VTNASKYVLFDTTNDHVAEQTQDLIERPGDARIADHHV
jgi:hypothetical protein